MGFQMKKLLLIVSILFLCGTSMSAQIYKVGLSYSTHQFNTRDFSAAGIHISNFSRFNAYHLSVSTKVTKDFTLDTRFSIGHRSVFYDNRNYPDINVGFTSTAAESRELQDNRFYGLSFDFKYDILKSKSGIKISPLVGLDILYEDHPNNFIFGFRRPLIDPENQVVFIEYTELVHHKVNPFVRLGFEVEKSLFEKLFLTFQLDYSIPLLGKYSTQLIEVAQTQDNYWEPGFDEEPTLYQQDLIRNRLFTFNTRVGLSYKFR